jgi:single-stranded-DNA-specific exonuclease
MDMQWTIRRPDRQAVKDLATGLDCHPLIAALLVNRGIRDRETAEIYLRPTLATLRSPFTIRDMDAAVTRIHRGIEAHERILVFGDYDVDGVTGTTLLVEFLSATGADVSYYIPHRTREGYGLRAAHITDHAQPAGIDLIITVDCGSSSRDAVQAAAARGIDVIVTDHHTISEPIPEAAAVVNPRRADCPSGFGHLAGVGVAFALIICLRRHLREHAFWKERPEPNLKDLCDLVALGTVADMVPLITENRSLSRAGLEVINTGRRPGIQALIRASGMRGNLAGAEDIAFRLGPRINAAGRIEHAAAAVELLSTDDNVRAARIAADLNRLNQQRRETEGRILAQILEHLAAHPRLLARKTLVLSHPDWHEGVLGIVASKLKDRFYRPTILLTVRDGVGRGSGRSIPGIDLYSCLADCAEMLTRFGGHTMAAGMSLDADRVAAFRDRFESVVAGAAGDETFVPELDIDGEIDLADVSAGFLDELEMLSPFGAGNPEPLFMARNIIVAHSRIVGQYHRRMTLRQQSDAGSRSIQAIQFRVDPHERLPSRFDRLAFRLGWNRWNGRKTPQIIVTQA